MSLTCGITAGWLMSCSAPRADIVTAGCADIGIFGIGVYVRDSVTGAFMASHARVWARSATYADSATGNSSSAADTMPINVVNGIAGTYAVTVSKPGYNDWVQSGIVVRSTSPPCPTIISTTVTAKLQKAN